MQTYKPLLLVLLLAGCALFSRTPPVTLRFHEEVNAATPEKHTRAVKMPVTGLRLRVDAAPQITEKDVYSAQFEDVPGGRAIRIQFDLHGANKLLEMTTRMRGQHIVVFVNDQPRAAVRVEQRLTDGSFLLEGDLTDQEQETLVAGLNKYAGRRRDIGDTRYLP